MYRRLFVSVNPFHARHVRELQLQLTQPLLLLLLLLLYNCYYYYYYYYGYYYYP